MNKKKSIMLITGFFPPLNRMGSSRPFAWSEYLQNSAYKVKIETYKKVKLDGPLDLDKINTAKLNEFSVLPKAFYHWSYPKIFKKMARKAEKVLWVFSFLFKNTASVDVVLSTYSPPHTILAGWVLKKKNRKIKWLVDYRDQWYGNPYSKKSALMKVLECYLIKSADQLITVSPTFASNLAALHEKPVCVIYNGYDKERDGRADLQDLSVEFENNKTVFLHVGTIYKGYRDPSELFLLFKDLIARGHLKANSFEIVFIGDRLADIEKKAEDHGVQNYVKCFPAVPRRESLALQRKSDCLILLSSGGDESKGIVPGKVFEYIQSGKPIIASGPSQKSDVMNLLLEAKVGHSISHEEKFLDSIIGMIEKGITPHWFNPDDQVIAQLSRESQCKNLDDLLEKMMIDRFN